MTSWLRERANVLLAGQTWPQRALGRRGSFLMFLAALDVVVAIRLLCHDSPAADLLLPGWAWATAWLATAAICTAGAARTGLDKLAFTVAGSVKPVWAGIWVQAWLVHGDTYGPALAALWVTLAATVLLVSGWPEPAPVP